VTEGSGRRKARREALFVLYQGDLLARDPIAPSDQGVAEGDYQVRLIDGVTRHVSDLDAELTDHLEGWKLERLAPLERNILRIGLYEIRYEPDTPPAVAVAEAVALAKRYCSDEAGRLVNGVLGSFVA
jgi:N utilization substance protein B